MTDWAMETQTKEINENNEDLTNMRYQTVMSACTSLMWAGAVEPKQTRLRRDTPSLTRRPWVCAPLGERDRDPEPVRRADNSP